MSYKGGYIMKLRATILTTFALLLAPLGAYADDVDDLKATLAGNVEAYNSIDADALCKGMHEKVVSYQVNSLFAAHGKQEACAALRSNFANLEQSHLTLQGTKYQVIGSTAMAWGHWQYVFKQKGDGLEVHNGRWVGTFVKSDGNWLQTTFSSTEFAPSLSQ